MFFKPEQLKFNINFYSVYNGAEKDRRGIEESRMERASDDNSISGGPLANSYPTCIFRLTPSFVWYIWTSEHTTDCYKSRTLNVDVLKIFSSFISKFPFLAL